MVRARVSRLAGLASELKARLLGGGADSRRAELELRAVSGEINRMAEELRDYEALRDGRAEVGTAKTLEELPVLLVRARIAAGLSQAELASRLGLQEQQIQRYESTRFEAASLARLQELAKALGVSTDLSVTSPAGRRSRQSNAPRASKDS